MSTGNDFQEEDEIVDPKEDARKAARNGLIQAGKLFLWVAGIAAIAAASNGVGLLVLVPIGIAYAIPAVRNSGPGKTIFPDVTKIWPGIKGAWDFIKLEREERKSEKGTGNEQKERGSLNRQGSVYFVESSSPPSSPSPSVSQSASLTELKTQLVEAVEKGNKDDVARLVQEFNERGGKINQLKDSNGYSLLRNAMNKENIEIGAILVQAGADVNAQDAHGFTPLHFAAYEGKITAIKFLLEQGAKINTPDNNGNTPLHYAAEAGHVEAVKLLYKTDFETLKNMDVDVVNVNAQNHARNTPLHLAMGELAKDPGNKDLNAVVEYLKKECIEIDQNLRNKNGQTPAEYAASLSSQKETVASRVDSGTTPKRFTPLRIAKDVRAAANRQAENIQKNVRKVARRIRPGESGDKQ